MWWYAAACAWCAGIGFICGLWVGWFSTGKAIKPERFRGSPFPTIVTDPSVPANEIRFVDRKSGAYHRIVNIGAGPVEPN